MPKSNLSCFNYMPLPEGYINVAAICPGTRVLGPGLRFVVWVQGCCFECPGCISPDWREMKPVNLYKAQELAGAILRTHEIDGITLSGGEPMLQADALVQMIRLVKAQKPLGVICFTGFTIEEITGSTYPGVNELLSEIDVLIDGPYVHSLNDNHGLRGSSNQRIHFLTEYYRYDESELLTGPRNIEIHLFHNQYLMVGVHPRDFSKI